MSRCILRRRSERASVHPVIRQGKLDTRASSSPLDATHYSTDSEWKREAVLIDALSTRRQIAVFSLSQFLVPPLVSRYAGDVNTFLLCVSARSEGWSRRSSGLRRANDRRRDGRDGNPPL